MRLVLFDIDGTILTARGAGRRALAAALTEVYGTAGDIERYDLRGRTDPRIVYDLMEGAGLAREAVRERLDDCFEIYARGLAAEIGDGSAVVTHPGIADLVRRLDGAPETLVGLLDGEHRGGSADQARADGAPALFPLRRLRLRPSRPQAAARRSPRGAPRR